MAVVSFMAVVLAVLTTPFTRNITTPTISSETTPRVTTISTIVKPTGPFLPSLALRKISRGELMAPSAGRSP